MSEVKVKYRLFIKEPYFFFIKNPFFFKCFRDVATVATCVAEALRQDCLEQGCISSAFSYSAIYRSRARLLYSSIIVYNVSVVLRTVCSLSSTTSGKG